MLQKLISYEHSTAPHRQVHFRFFLLRFLVGRLFRQALKLLEPLFILIILFLHLVPNKAHVLPSPNNWQLIGCGDCSG